VAGWYFPNAQSSHAETFGQPTKLPIVPLGQSMQSSALSDPSGAPYVPIAQSVHAVDAALGAYVPTEQLVHMDAPAALYIPASQSRQYEEPTTPRSLWYVPATHATHVPQLSL
jgi:hypothetical protein